MEVTWKWVKVIQWPTECACILVIIGGGTGHHIITSSNIVVNIYYWGSYWSVIL